MIFAPLVLDESIHVRGSAATILQLVCFAPLASKGLPSSHAASAKVVTGLQLPAAFHQAYTLPAWGLATRQRQQQHSASLPGPQHNLVMHILDQRRALSHSKDSSEPAVLAGMPSVIENQYLTCICRMRGSKAEMRSAWGSAYQHGTVINRPQK